MSARGARFAARLWDEPGGGWRLLRGALAPASALYRSGVLARDVAYRAGLFATSPVAARTVSIGNLRVGGSGKTPLTRWLAVEASARGVPVAIVSRGYGGAQVAPHVVGDGAELRSDVQASGDEAVMLARTAGVPVVAGRDRAAAAALARRDLRRPAAPLRRRVPAPARWRATSISCSSTPVSAAVSDAHAARRTAPRAARAR